MRTANLYRIAKRELDVHEASGAAASRQITLYLKTTTLSSYLNSTDETPWCSAFVNWVVEKSGLKGTDRADAVSWLEWGVATDSPVRGTIVIFQWANGGHHVGFFDELDGSGKIKLLGGNQSNSVKLSDYSSAYVIGYRNPKYNFLPSPKEVLTVVMVLLFILLVVAIVRIRMRLVKGKLIA